MTDAQLEDLIEKAKPHLRQAIRAVVENKSPVMMMHMGTISFPNKLSWEIRCFVMIEPMAELVAPLMFQGMPAMLQSQLKPHSKPEEMKQPALSGGLKVPGI